MSDTVVVADSTVLIFLGKLRRLEWLRTEYESVTIPPKVYEEVVEKGIQMGATDAVLVRNAVEDGWIEVRETDPHEDVETWDLEAGETEVLSLALTHGYEEVLADEESVREIARLNGLRPRGTLYFLLTAVRDGEITFEKFLDLLETLLEEGFYLDEAIYLEVVQEARRIADEHTERQG